MLRDGQSSKYTRQRNSLFRKLFQLLDIRPSEDLLLFGSRDLDIDSNIIVFTIIHKYISQSKRFSENSDTLTLTFINCRCYDVRC
jgi:hypothetical protein